jgi:lipopolysaccharide biosynthesis glycosyltransferase
MDSDTIAFNTVLQAWSISGQKGAALRAEQLLKHMSKLYHSGNDNVKPDCVSYSTVISTWANSSQRNAAEKALEMMHEMEEKCALGDKDICPSIVTYTAGKDSMFLSFHYQFLWDRNFNWFF